MKTIRSLILIVIALGSVCSEFAFADSDLSFFPQDCWVLVSGALIQDPGRTATSFSNTNDCRFQVANPFVPNDEPDLGCDLLPGALCVEPADSHLPSIAELKAQYEKSPDSLPGSYWSRDPEPTNEKKHLVFERGKVFGDHIKKGRHGVICVK